MRKYLSDLYFNFSGKKKGGVEEKIKDKKYIHKD